MTSLKALKSNPVPQTGTAGKPDRRFRRLRRTEGLRALVREHRLATDDLIYPLFVEEGKGEPTPIRSMPGVSRETEATIGSAVKSASDTGLKAVILFGISHNKDATGSDSWKPDGLLARMIKRAKDACPEMVVMADLCFCEYTDHGHCGVMSASGDVDNDATLENLARQAVTAADAGADLVAPSGMMDGGVAIIRAALDQTGHDQIPIMAYAAKFASHFYGPFRDAAGCSLGKGNRKTYQMDPANSREAIREARQDETEGADILMVKPGLPYLDVLTRLRDSTDLPLAAYQVSGEYAMIKQAALAGALNEQDVIMESLLAFKRAGADLILSYFAPEAARIIKAS